jgi:hypothetical protein
MMLLTQGQDHWFLLWVSRSRCMHVYRAVKVWSLFSWSGPAVTDPCHPVWIILWRMGIISPTGPSTKLGVSTHYTSYPFTPRNPDSWWPDDKAKLTNQKTKGVLVEPNSERKSCFVRPFLLFLIACSVRLIFRIHLRKSEPSSFLVFDGRFEFLVDRQSSRWIEWKKTKVV